MTLSQGEQATLPKMSFNDFIYVYSLKNKATSNIKTQQILSFLSLSNVGIYLGDGPFSTNMGVVNPHQKRNTLGCKQ